MAVHEFDGDQDDVNEAPHDGCTQCGGDLQLMGRLGRRNWYRCRSCGFDQSTHSPGGQTAPDTGMPVSAGSTGPGEQPWQ